MSEVLVLVTERKVAGCLTVSCAAGFSWYLILEMFTKSFPPTVFPFRWNINSVRCRRPICAGISEWLRPIWMCAGVSQWWPQEPDWMSHTFHPQHELVFLSLTVVQVPEENERYFCTSQNLKVPTLASPSSHTRSRSMCWLTASVV
jgi:hypothetical protein